jgi:hypothetical protein
MDGWMDGRWSVSLNHDLVLVFVVQNCARKRTSFVGKLQMTDVE